MLTTDNSLGIETYRTMIDLGFWKKLVYIGLDGKQALDLCYSFFNRTHYDLLTTEFIKPHGEIASAVLNNRSNLTMREFWLSVGSAIRDVKDDKKLSIGLKEASADFVKGLTEGEDTKSITDL